jgi:hypothetical protein
VSKKAGDTGIAPNLPFNHGIFHYNHENHPFGGTPICGNPHLGPFGGNDSPMTSIDGLGPGSLGLNNSIQQSVSTCDVYIYKNMYIYNYTIYTYAFILPYLLFRKENTYKYMANSPCKT